MTGFALFYLEEGAGLVSLVPGAIGPPTTSHFTNPKKPKCSRHENSEENAAIPCAGAARGQRVFVGRA